MSYIYLTLDTTPPELSIFVPSYTTKTALTPIRIQSNESLSTYQEIYIIDALGNRHDLTFAHEDNLLVGECYILMGIR